MADSGHRTKQGDSLPKCQCGHANRSHRNEDNGWGGVRFCKVRDCRCLNFEPPSSARGDSQRRTAASWQTGTQDGIATYSMRYIWNATSTRMLCGVAPGWKIGNFGLNYTERCQRCYAIAAGDGLIIEGEPDA